MPYPEVQFVAAPEVGAAVLFDFNSNTGTAPAQIIDGTFTLGTPSVTGDPDGLGVQYGPREVGFSLLVYGPRAAALATQALLARTFMLRRRGWLRVKMDAVSAPVWVRTYTPTPGELDFQFAALDGEPDAWQIEVTVAAEPLVRGVRIALWSGTINNNPVHATNPMGVTLPAVIGDAPAPLRIEANFSATHNQADILWSTAAVPSGHTPIVWKIGTGDGWTLGSDTSAPVADATFSNSTYRRVTFATTTTLTTRLAGPAPAAVAPGRYRVMLRTARDATTGSFAFRLGYRTLYGGDRFEGSPTVVMDRGTSAATVHTTWVDLGEFTFPTPRTSADLTAVAGIPQIALQVARLSGSANCVLDAFVLLPVDVATVTTLESWEKCDILVSEFAGQGPQAIAGEEQVWDGDSESSVRRDPAGLLDALVMPANRGQFPTVRPGVLNRLSLIQQMRLAAGSFGTTNNTDVLTHSAFVEVSYQPRHLWLGAA